MDADYLQKYYLFERNHWWFLVREKIIIQQLNRSLPSGKRLKILNAGAATGRSSQMLQQYGDVTSVEIDPDTCRFLKEKLNLNVVEAAVEKLPFESETFDIVCVFDVLEHIDNDAQAVAELFRVCKTGGSLYCSVPAFNFLWSMHDEVNHHIRRYTRKTITNAIQTKFKVVYISYFNFLLFPPIFFCRMLVKCFSRPTKVKSDFEYSKLLNGRFFSFFLKAIFSMEIFLLRYCTLPFGVSILLRAKKEIT